MPAIGITGGIATGKSTFTRALLRLVPAELFDADRCAHELLVSDSEVHSAIRRKFGNEVFSEDGKPARGLLRERVFSDDNARRELEAILHPVIRNRWQTMAENLEGTEKFLCVDLPLLYETEAEAHFDRVIVVACSPETQRHRLRAIRGLSDELADKMLGAQLALPVKMTRCDHLIWNDSSPTALDGQAALLADWLRQRYGQRNH